WGVIEWQAVESSRSLTFAPFRVGLVRLVDPDEIHRWAEPARSALIALAPGLGRGSLRFAARPALVTALVAAIERVSEDRPLLVAIDDAPWLDGPSREVLHAVAAGLRDRPILLAVTIRDDEPHPDETAHPSVEIRPGEGLDLALGPLAQRDVERLIVEHLGGDTVSAEVLRLSYDQGAGNPLFCLELVRHWREAGRVRMEGGRWVATAGVPDAGLPVTIRRLVERRAATLPANAREILAVAARMGPDLGFTELAAATSIPQESLVEAIDTAIASGLLVEQGAGYAFAHPLYRVAFDAPVGTAQTAGMRLRIARALARVEAGAPPDALIRAAAAMVDPRPVAEHALAAAELGESDARTLAVAFGFAAGDRARSLFDGARAVELLERSLAVWRQLPPDIGVAFPASAACVSLIDLNTHVAGGADAAAARAFREAVGTARDAGELASAYAARFWQPYRHGDFDGAIGILEAGLRALPPEAVAARARLRSNVGWCLYRLRRLDDALPVLEDVVATLEASSDRRGTMQALDYFGVLLRDTERHDEGIGCLERSLRLAYELGDSRGELLAEIHLTSAFTRIGRASLARPHRARAIPLARQIGDQYAEAVATWTAADLEDLAGDLPAAAALRHEELRLLAAIGGNAHNEALAHAHLANLAWRSGDEAAFRAESDIAVGLAEQSDDPTYPARIRRALQAPDWWRLET
ncbi:MAG: hypothetical protein MUE82_05785, partial [Chloroflexi bacterium]|nr:hypothetical protein [Chloroflexota bacterium]